MVSLYKSVLALYEENNAITLRELTNIWEEANPETLKRYLSEARRLHSKDDSKKIPMKISLETIEPLVARSLEKNPSGKALDQAIKILQIKQQDTSLMNEIDLTKFYKKAMEEDQNDG